MRCRCSEAYTVCGRRDPDCQCDSAEAVKVVAERIKELEVKLEALDRAYDSIVQALRFEALRTDDAEAKLAKAVGALGDIYDGEPEWPDEPEKELEWCRNRAKRALAELKGQNDD